jgi:hypothetical protein
MPKHSTVEMLIRLKHWLRIWRRGLKSKLPYVRRRVYRKALTRCKELTWALTEAAPASSAQLDVIYLRQLASTEVCFFVTYAPQPIVKNHVLEHIRALRAEGFEVVLTLNTPHDASAFSFSEELTQLCHGLFVRENKGFDFGAWSHMAFITSGVDK